MSRTISNGQGLAVSVGPGESIAISSVSGTFTATVTQGTSAGTVLATASTGGGTYGPYTSGAVVQITAGADSVIDFDVGTSPALTYTNDARFATDSSGNVTGLVGPSGGVIGLGNSVKTVLFGDSMTDTYETSGAGLNGVYNVNTGDLVLSLTGHQQAVGWYITVWNRVFASTIKQFRVQVASITDANTLTVNIGAGLAGVVTDSNWFARPESWRSSQAFVPWLQAISGQRFNIVYNGAQSGDTTQNALDRLQRDCLAYNPSVVIMQIPGINDTSTGNGNIAEDTIFNNQKSIVSQIAATNAKLILISLTPPAAGDGRSTLVNMIRVIRLNRRLQEYVSTIPNVIWFDAFKRIVDPASASGAALVNFVRTTDKIHYSMRGGKYIADQLWSQISTAFQTDNSTLPVSVIDSYTNSAITLTSVTASGGVVSATSAAHGIQTGETLKVTGGSASLNGYVVVTSTGTNTLTFPYAVADGSITGTIKLGRSRNLYDYPTLATATGGTVVAPGTGTNATGIKTQNIAGAPAFSCSVVARSDGYGNDQQVVITPAASGDTFQLSFDFAQSNTLLPTVVMAGRSYVFEFELTMTGVSGSNLTEIRPLCTATVGGTTYQAYGLHNYADGANLNSDVTSLHIRTAPLKLPSGAVTVVNGSLALRFSALGTALTVKVGRINLTELS